MPEGGRTEAVPLLCRLGPPVIDSGSPRRVVRASPSMQVLLTSPHHSPTPPPLFPPPGFFTSHLLGSTRLGSSHQLTYWTDTIDRGCQLILIPRFRSQPEDFCTTRCTWT